MTWFYLAISSVFALAAAELLQQHLLNQKEALHERTSAVLTFFVQWLLSLPFSIYIILSEQAGEFNLKTILSVFLVTSLASVGMVYYLRSFKVKNISFSQIFISSSIVVSTVLGIVLFDEAINAAKMAGILLILVAIVGINLRNKHLEKNHFYALIAAGIFGVCFAIDKSIALNTNPFVYISSSFILLSVYGTLAAPKVVIKDIKRLNYRLLRPVVLSGVAYFAYNSLTFSAYSVGGDVGKVDAINNTQVFIVILFEYFVLKSRHSLIRKMLLSTVAFSGVLLLAL